MIVIFVFVISVNRLFPYTDSKLVTSGGFELLLNQCNLK